LRFSIIPKENRFFELFKNDISNIVKGVTALREMIHDYENVKVKSKKVDEFENAGDEITHEIMNLLSTTFVTPFDREDIYELVSQLDNILDLSEEVADTMFLYKIEKPTPELIEMSDVLVEACRELEKAIYELEKLKDLQHFWINIHTLENRGDKLYRKAISKLFSADANPIDVIKYKDVYRLTEAAIDKCEDVANIIENIVLKHA
jgi:hypothetical protein